MPSAPRPLKACVHTCIVTRLVNETSADPWRCLLDTGRTVHLAVASVVSLIGEMVCLESVKKT